MLGDFMGVGLCELKLAFLTFSLRLPLKRASFSFYLILFLSGTYNPPLPSRGVLLPDGPICTYFLETLELFKAVNLPASPFSLLILPLNLLLSLAVLILA